MANTWRIFQRDGLPECVIDQPMPDFNAPVAPQAEDPAPLPPEQEQPPADPNAIPYPQPHHRIEAPDFRNLVARITEDAQGGRQIRNPVRAINAVREEIRRLREELNTQQEELRVDMEANEAERVEIEARRSQNEARASTIKQQSPHLYQNIPVSQYASQYTVQPNVRILDGKEADEVDRYNTELWKTKNKEIDRLLKGWNDAYDISEESIKELNNNRKKDIDFYKEDLESLCKQFNDIIDNIKEVHKPLYEDYNKLWEEKELERGYSIDKNMQAFAKDPFEYLGLLGKKFDFLLFFPCVITWFLLKPIVSYLGLLQWFGIKSEKPATEAPESEEGNDTTPSESAETPTAA